MTVPLERIEATLTRLEATVEAGFRRQGRQLDDLRAAVVYLHREDLRDDPEACDRLGVEPADLRVASDGERRP